MFFLLISTFIFTEFLYYMYNKSLYYTLKKRINNINIYKSLLEKYDYDSYIKYLHNLFKYIDLKSYIIKMNYKSINDFYDNIFLQFMFKNNDLINNEQIINNFLHLNNTNKEEIKNIVKLNQNNNIEGFTDTIYYIPLCIMIIIVSLKKIFDLYIKYYYNYSINTEEFDIRVVYKKKSVHAPSIVFIPSAFGYLYYIKLLEKFTDYNIYIIESSCVSFNSVFHEYCIINITEFSQQINKIIKKYISNTNKIIMSYHNYFI